MKGGDNMSPKHQLVQGVVIILLGLFWVAGEIRQLSMGAIHYSWVFSFLFVNCGFSVSLLGVGMIDSAQKRQKTLLPPASVKKGCDQPSN